MCTRILLLLVLAMAIPACVPEPGTLEYQQYQKHKANRNAVMGQGGR